MNKWYFWILPILLFSAQFIFTLNSTSQIRYEELAEGVRNPFWLSQRLIYDGTSSNVGWYGILLILYKILGFGLFTAKYFRLFLHLLSLVSLAYILKRFLGEKLAILPLLVIGLSPSWLYLNTLQTSYGTDLQYFPIILAMLISPVTFLLPIAWALAMIAWTSYPTFIVYLPVLLMVSLSFPRKRESINNYLYRSRIKYGMTILISFLTPLILIFTYVKNRNLLLFDPKTSTGMFRGAGGLSLDSQNFAANLTGLIKDLFISGQSYHFELNKVEFSLIFPIITLVTILVMSLKLLRNNGYNSYKNYKLYIFLAWIMLLAAILLPSLTLDPSGAPGMRRYSAVLAAFYGLMVLMYKDDKWRKISVIALSILTIHHLSVFPVNLTHLSDSSPYKEPVWFRDTPAESLQTLVNTAQKQDLKLICDNCRLPEVYAAVAGSCEWNHLNCQQIQGYDLNKGQFINLSVDLWDKYYFEH